MRIGMMLRSLDEKGGIGVYTHNLIQELLCIDRRNQYILLYRHGSNLGRFAQYQNVTERVVKAPNKAFWDQVAIPYACWKEQVDVVFHPERHDHPVAGVQADQLLDTYTQARAGGRPHDAIDIMAPAGTPVVAAAEGTVEKLFFSQGGGGITAYVRSPDRRWTYYYAHLQGYAPGLREGQRVMFVAFGGGLTWGSSLWQL